MKCRKDKEGCRKATAGCRKAKVYPATGQVTYAGDGTFLPNTIITATSPDGSFKKATSGQTGKYRIFSLEGNIYTITVEKQGFVTQVIEDVGVSVEGIVDLDVQLVKE